MQNVLVVDDDPELVRLVSAWLNQAGYETASVCDAMTCIQYARRSKPDAIVLDLGLPAGGGLIALERLKRNNETAGIPVVVLTARNTATARTQAEEAGAHAFVAKEGTKDELLAALSKACSNERDIPDSF